MPQYANIVDLSEIDSVGRIVVSGWIDKDSRKDLEPDKIDGFYAEIVGDNPTQIEARAEILNEQFGVRVKTN